MQDSLQVGGDPSTSPPAGLAQRETVQRLPAHLVPPGEDWQPPPLCHPLQSGQALPSTTLLSEEGTPQRAWPSREGLPPRPSPLSLDLSPAPALLRALALLRSRQSQGGLSLCSAPLPVDFRPLPQPGGKLSAPISPARCSICQGDGGGLLSPDLGWGGEGTQA